MPADPHLKVLELLPYPAFLATEKGNIIFANDALMRAAGKVGKDFSTYDLYAIGLFRDERDFYDFISNFSHADRFIHQLSNEAVLGKQSKGIFLHATTLYIDKTKKYCFVLTPPSTIEREIPLPLLDQVIENIPHFIFQTDMSGRVLFANEQFCEVMECPDLSSFDSIGGFTKFDLEHSQRTWRSRIARLKQEKSIRFKTHFQRKDGTILPVEVFLSLVEKDNEMRLIFYAQDISEQRRLEAELRSALLEIEALSFNLTKDNLALQQELESEHRFDQIVSVSPAYQPVLNKISQVAETDSTVLITGETGTGKELIARAIHANSTRAERPLITINCAAIPAELIESELFGHKKGAFTGAERNRLGRFELADEGTIFLDEIGEMPLMLQSRLLRVLQEGEFVPVGGKEVVYTNVRVLAATNRNLRQLVADNHFRADLFFRLNVFPIHSIPLRERPEDIPALLEYFIKKYNDKLNRRVTEVRPQDLRRLQQYHFPGNIRELENIVERALILSTSEVLELSWDSIADPPLANSNPTSADPADLPEGLKTSAPESFLALDTMQKRYIEDVLRHTRGKVSGPGGAAEILGLKPQTLFSKLRKLGIDRSEL